ncbi:hypothetical protein D3C74_261360 [compost metagenome]
MSTQIKLQLIKTKETKSVVSKFLEGDMELEHSEWKPIPHGGNLFFIMLCNKGGIGIHG